MTSNEIETPPTPQALTGEDSVHGLLAGLEAEARKLDAQADSFKGVNIPEWYKTVADRDSLNAAAETLRRRSANVRDDLPGTAGARGACKEDSQ